MRLGRVGIYEIEDLPDFVLVIRASSTIRLGAKCWDEILTVLEQLGLWTYPKDQTNHKSSEK
jgi:hypothetical protein